MTTDERFRKLARDQHQKDGTCEIDDDAVVSRANEERTGAYVQAWVWVESNPEDDA